MCRCACTNVLVQVPVCMAYIWVAEVNIRFCFSGSTHISFEIGSSFGPGQQIKCGCLTNKPCGGLSLLLQIWD